MANRPNQVVYQEYKKKSALAPIIPDLDVLVVGVCNQVMDYADDKDDLLVGSYGKIHSLSPIGSIDSEVFSEPANLLPGAKITSDDVTVYLDDAELIIKEYTGSGLGDEVKYSSGDNLVTVTSTTASAGCDIYKEGIRTGDSLYVNNKSNSVGIKTQIKEIHLAFKDVSASPIDFRTSGVVPGDILSITDADAASERNGVYTVLRVRPSNVNTLEVVAADIDQVPDASAVSGTAITVKSASGTTKVTSADSKISDYFDMRVTTDFAETAESSDAVLWRVSREYRDVKLDASDYSINNNEVTLKANITVDIDSATTGKKISYSSVYIEYLAIRSDLQKIITLESSVDIANVLGDYDSRNPLAVGATIAKKNTSNTRVKVYGVKANTIDEYTRLVDILSSTDEVYSIVPLTQSSTILSYLTSTVNQVADPEYVLNKGIKQRFRSVVGSIEKPSTKTLSAVAGNTSVGSPAGYTSNSKRLLEITASTADTDLSTKNVLPGDKLEISNAGGTVLGTFVVSELRAGSTTVTKVLVDTENTALDAVYSASETFKFYHFGETTEYGTLTATSGTRTLTLVSAVAPLNLELTGAGVDYIAGNIIPGDVLQIPSNPTVNDFTDYTEYVVDEVVSSTRIRVYNYGANTSTSVVELPKGFRRSDGSSITDGTIYHRVIRMLTKDEQINLMITEAQNYGAKRLVLAYPDEVLVEDLVDGSLEYIAGHKAPADYQPGYYIAAGVGGLNAGQPSQQSFTNGTIAGISAIKGSNDHFNEEQITELSGGGIWVYIQPNEDLPPVCVHALTTDSSSLEFSEQMAIKNYDKVAWAFLRTITGYTGKWNNIPEASEFIEQDIMNTGGVLKRAYISKIGAPLKDYTMDHVGPSDISDDRIEAVLNVDLPMVLNTVALHLVG